MITTNKRITLSLTKESVRQLDELMDLFGETQSDVFQRALVVLHLLYKDHLKALTISSSK